MANSTYSQAMAEIVCAQLADGLSLREISRQDGMPDKATVMRWLHAHSDFRDQYVRAKEIGIEIGRASCRERV